MRAISVLASIQLTAALLGCESLREAPWTTDTEYTGSTASIQAPGEVKYFPSDEMLRLASEHFSRGDYGTAERYFRDAVEKAPEDTMAWIGLAASYDRIGRYDLADRAYQETIRLAGETPQILNNLGFSYMLRGDLPRARATFEKALARDPQNPTIINNIELLGASHRFIQRNPPGAN